MSATTISVSNVIHAFTDRDGQAVRAVDDVSFDVQPGEFTAIVGPSGCGKTTVLNMIAGLVRPDHGSVRIGTDDCLKPRRETAYMFARDGLLPWRTAERNVAFGLELRGQRRRESEPEARRLLAMVGLADYANHYPSQLSQGMRQRVALARTMATRPDVILLDEPFAALDAQTRVLLQDEFLKVRDELGCTVILVTHDLAEAVALSDRVLVFSGRPGRVVLDIPVDIPRPRDVGAVRFDERFTHISESIWRSLREEVVLA